MPSRYSFAWRDRVADPDFLVWCHCGHAEQIHDENHGACTAGPVGRRCMCATFTEKRREWVGIGDAPCRTCGGQGVVIVAGPDESGMYDADDCPECS